MLTHLNYIFRTLLITIFVSGLVACGGGSSDSTPANRASDTIPPKVVATNPTSEQSGIRVNTDIKVTFNKNISDISSSNVGIYPFVADAADKSKAVDFKITNTSNSLTITPTIGALSPATTYQVVITAVKNSDGVEMTTPCEWIFVTEGGTAINSGLTGVCGTTPPQEKPGEPLNLKAIAGDSLVTLSWTTPITGGTPTYYKVDKTSDNKQTYTPVNLNVPATTLTVDDPDVQNGTTYIYRVIAGNNINESTAVFSQPVTPNTGQVSSAPGTPVITSVTAGDGTVTINWTAPTTGGAVQYYKVDKSIDNQQTFTSVNTNVPATTLTITDPNAQNGTSHIYKVTAGNSVNLGAPAISNAVTPVVVVVELTPASFLASQTPATTKYFGYSIAYSADGNTLAIADTSLDQTTIGDNVQIFTKSTGGSWSLTQTITPTTTPTNYFGTSMAFSLDGTTLAIGQTMNRGTVHLYIKSGSTWVFSQIITSSVTLESFLFGYALAFSPDSTTLAVGDITAEVNTLNAGKVELFVRAGTNWNIFQTLTAQIPTSPNYFGSKIIFSPDGTYLAIGERQGDPATSAANAGLVHIFRNSGGSWVFLQSVGSQTPVSNGNIGGLDNIAFSTDNQTLAIGDPRSTSSGIGSVQLFSKSGSTWVSSELLTAQSSRIGDNFGISLAFSFNGNILAVTGKPVSGEDLKVQLLYKTGTTWSLSARLTSNSPTIVNNFGSPMIVFSPDGTTLAVVEQYGDVGGISDAGVVNIFDITQFP